MTKLKPKVDNELIHRGDLKLRIMSFFFLLHLIDFFEVLTDSEFLISTERLFHSFKCNTGKKYF